MRNQNTQHNTFLGTICDHIYADGRKWHMLLFRPTIIEKKTIKCINLNIDSVLNLLDPILITL